MTDQDIHRTKLWAREKILLALLQSAALIDLAKEADTNEWYRRVLRHGAGSSIERLVPVIEWLTGRREDQSASREASAAIREGGTKALEEWASKLYDHEVVWTRHYFVDPLASEGKSERINREVIPATVINKGLIRSTILKNCASWLLERDDVESRATKRLLLKIMSSLCGGEYVDTVTVNRYYLPVDIKESAEDTEDAFRALWEAGVIEPVDYLPAPENPDAMLLRIAMLGNNETKYPQPYPGPHGFGQHQDSAKTGT